MDERTERGGGWAYMNVESDNGVFAAQPLECSDFSLKSILLDLSLPTAFPTSPGTLPLPPLMLIRLVLAVRMVGLR